MQNMENRVLDDTTVWGDGMDMDNIIKDVRHTDNLIYYGTVIDILSDNYAIKVYSGTEPDIIIMEITNRNTGKMETIKDTPPFFTTLYKHYCLTE